MYWHFDRLHHAGSGGLRDRNVTSVLTASDIVRFFSGDVLTIFTDQSQELVEQHDEMVELYDQNRPALFGYLISLGLMPQESDDVIQDAFLRFHRFLVSGGKIENPRSWLFRVSHNLAHNLRKRERRFVSHNDEPEFVSSVQRPAPEPSPEEVYLNNERFLRLKAAVSQLTEHQQACLQLRAEGLRYREIAEVLGISVSGVSETLKRAVIHLMSRL